MNDKDREFIEQAVKEITPALKDLNKILRELAERQPTQEKEKGK